MARFGLSKFAPVEKLSRRLSSVCLVLMVTLPNQTWPAAKKNQPHLRLCTVVWEPVLHIVITLPTEPAGPFTFFFFFFFLLSVLLFGTDWCSHVEAVTEMFMLQHIARFFRSIPRRHHRTCKPVQTTELLGLSYCFKETSCLSVWFCVCVCFGISTVCASHALRLTSLHLEWS